VEALFGILLMIIVPVAIIGVPAYIFVKLAQFFEKKHKVKQTKNPKPKPERKAHQPKLIAKGTETLGIEREVYLIVCGVCDGKVASNAVTCPHCGAPQANGTVSVVAEQGSKPKPKFGYLGWVILVLGLGMMGNCLEEAGCTDSASSSSTTSSRRVRQNRQPRCDAQRAMVVRNLANAKCSQYSIESCARNVMRTGVPYDVCVSKGSGCFRNTVRELGCSNSRFFD
jgi:hypothetical protein